MSGLRELAAQATVPVLGHDDTQAWDEHEAACSRLAALAPEMAALLADAVEAVEAYRQTFPANPAHPNDAAVAATLDALLARFAALNQKAAQ